jgi:hypothetical protein
MATGPTTTISPLLRRIAEDLGASHLETRLADDGDLVADMHAMGHRLSFRVNQQGEITERFCHQDPAIVLNRGEMQLLLALVEREMASMGSGHLSTERHGPRVFHVLGRAEIKLALALAGTDALTRDERTILAEALEKYSANLDRHIPDESMRKETRRVLHNINHKLGV